MWWERKVGFEESLDCWRRESDKFLTSDLNFDTTEIVLEEREFIHQTIWGEPTFDHVQPSVLITNYSHVFIGPLN